MVDRCDSWDIHRYRIYASVLLFQLLSLNDMQLIVGISANQCPIDNEYFPEHLKGGMEAGLLQQMNVA